MTIFILAQPAPILDDHWWTCNTIRMIWNAEPYEENMCEITRFQLLCFGITHNFTMAQDVADEFDRNFDLTIDVLRQDHTYECLGYIFVTLTGFSPPSLPLIIVAGRF